tara:strand:+ start:35 stop:391 length:357 start_codon:yes stop_codon:yes gene_type:complete
MSNKSEFKEKLKKWVKCEQEIKKLNLAIKEIRKLKNDLSPEIKKYMEKKNKEYLSINKNYQIKYTQSQYYQGINRNYINSKINEYTKNEELSHKITNYIYNQRNKNERSNLSIIKKKN